MPTREGMPLRQKRTLAREGLYAMAHRLGPGAKLPGVRELRQELGVSLSTLDTVLAELETRRVILRRQGSGIFVSPSLGRRTICLLCTPTFFVGAGSSPFWGMLVERVKQRAAENFEELVFHFAGGEGEAALADGLVDAIRQGRIDGVIAVGIDSRTVDWIVAHHVPIVAYAATAPHLFSHPWRRVVELAVDELVARGCRRLAFWAPLPPLRSLSDEPRKSVEKEAFREALARHKRIYDPRLVDDNLHRIGSDQPWTAISHQEQGYITARRVLQERREMWPDGVVSTDDMLTLGALAAMQELGVVPGRDLQIATHGNVGSPALLGWERRLTRILLDPGELVQRLFETLEALMDGEAIPPGDFPLSTTVIRPDSL